MRASLLRGDIRFQFRYGFYFVYLVFSILYLCLLTLFPPALRGKAAVLMIFSDPAAMGLYFMGAILLFEKSQRVLDSIAVSPVKPMEYALAKLVSLGLVSTAVGLPIGFFGGIVKNPFFFLTGVFLGSCLFSAMGLIIALHIETLNQFIVATIPAEILINLPAIAYLLGWRKSFLILHPGVCVIELCENGELALPAALILLVWTAVFALLSGRSAGRSFRSLGGIKL
ncbi:hypothetical protein SDC9_49221 [bioreactor metagenome]|uniref:ABC-2 type transporter domain-containing protein n=1 Tax=bioreactor metagenome TaxID=1076179 RepID=A0A644WGR2_9ZZZZ